MCIGARGDEIKSPGAEVIGSCELPTWVIETELTSSERAGSAFNHGTISLGSRMFVRFVLSIRIVNCFLLFVF